IVERRGEVADVFLEPRARIRERQPGAGILRRFGDGPRDRTFVGDADDEAVLAGEVGHVSTEGDGRFANRSTLNDGNGRFANRPYFERLRPPPPGPCRFERRDIIGGRLPPPPPCRDMLPLRIGPPPWKLPFPRLP